MLGMIIMKNTVIKRTGVNMYCFYIRFKNGRTEYTNNLTKRQAVIRYNKYGKTDWYNEANSYGWKEV